MAAPTEFQLIAGHPALDLVNTVDWRWDPPRARWEPQRTEELLRSFQDLVRWARQTAVVTAAEARGLGAAARRDPRSAARALDRARQLRAALGRVFEAASRGRRPAALDLGRFNAFLGTALRRRRIALRGKRYDWTWADADPGPLEAILSPVVLAAAELLTSPQRIRIRACAAEECGWLFLDTSRSGRRRWCSMQTCGNRAKARRFHARASASSPTREARRLATGGGTT